MSELSNRVSEKPEHGLRQGSPLLPRATFILAFVLFVGIVVAFTPRIAQQIAYSWNIGVEQAKTESAKQFLDDNPSVALEQRTVVVAKAVISSVVVVHTITTKPPEEYNIVHDGRDGHETLGIDLGSGVIVDDRGYIVTNEHVIRNAHEIRVQLSDGRVINAEFIGQDRAIDIAVLRIDVGNLHPIDWGDSQQVVVGERVLAIGTPFGLQQTITSGIISATKRYEAAHMILGPRRGAATFPHEFLLTDAPINPGNSGGALVDMNGKLIGICQANYSSEYDGNSGIGRAIPSAMVKRIYEEIISHSDVKRGWIGVQTDDLVWYDAQKIGQERPQGAIIERFSPRSPAKAAGLQMQDVILRWGETEITCPLHLTHLVTLTTPGTVIPVEVFRKGEILTFDVTVGTRPTEL